LPSLLEESPQANYPIGWQNIYQFMPCIIVLRFVWALAIESDESTDLHQSNLNDPAQHRIHHIDHDGPIGCHSSIANDRMAPFVLLSCWV
jgi:hypothetical protein